MTPSHIIHIESLSKSFGENLALDRVSLQVNAGEIFGLIGPDGAGKTTLMRIACGLLLPASGRALILGHDCSSESRLVKEQLGYMPQRFSLYPDLTVEENLRFYADLHYVPAALRKERESRLMEFSRLAPFKSRRAGKLSGGMKQKLALCCTLIHAPGVLILDEPTTGFDPVSRREFWDILRATAAEGKSILVSTPYMDEAQLCHRVALMYKGKILGVGTPSEVTALFSQQLVEVFGEELERARKILLSLPSQPFILNRFGDRLHIIFEDEQAREQIQRALQDVRVYIEPINPSIEDTFVSLMNQQAA